MALVTVLGTILVLVAIATGILSQTRSQLRSGRLEADVAQAHLLIWAGMNETVQQAEEHPGWFADAERYPDPTQAPPADWSPCAPKPVDPGDVSGPAYCTDILRRQTISMDFEGVVEGYAQVPIAIRWRLRVEEPVKVTYGWIVIRDDQGSYEVTPYYFHRWCTPRPDWESNLICEQGG